MKKTRKNMAIETAHQIDKETGIYDKKSFDDLIAKEVLRASRSSISVCTAVISIDNFARVSKLCGPAGVNSIIHSIAKVVKKNIRAYFPICILGKNEIGVIFPDTIKRVTISILKSVRQKVAQTAFHDKNNKIIYVTLSIGIANYPENALNTSKLMGRTREALSLAKKENGNRVLSYVTTSHTSTRLAVIPPAISTPFYSFVLLGMREIIEDAGNIELLLFGGTDDLDFKSHEEGIKQALAAKPDVIALCSKINPGKYIKKANEMKIPVFGFNLMSFKMSPKGRVLSHVGYDQREAGRKVGRYLARILRGKGKVAILEGVVTENDSIDRTKGFLDIVKKYPGIKVVEKTSAEWMRKTAEKITKGILNRHHALDAIFCLNDEMAIGAGISVRDKGKQGKIFIVGLDGSRDGLQSIKDGLITATMNGNPIEMGRVLTRTILRSMIKEEKIPAKVESPTMMVDLVNIDSYLR